MSSTPGPMDLPLPVRHRNPRKEHARPKPKAPVLPPAAPPAAMDRPAAAAPAVHGDAPLISVVIPTFRRPQLLQRCLEALVDQHLDAAAFEIIVVDDGQTDDTREAVEHMAIRTAGRPRIAYLRPEGTRGPAAARNRGWRAAAAPVIAFTDDDTVPDADWLRYGVLAMSVDRVAAWGRVVVPTSANPTDHERNTQGLETAGFVTANCFVRRDALEAIGGFDERFKRAWREDADLYFTLLRRFGRVDPVPAAMVVHPVREAPWGISLKQQANMVFDALLYKKHPAHYREMIRRLPPWRYYVIVLGALGALVAGLAGSSGLAMVLLLVSLGFIAAFARQRLRGTSHHPRHVAEMLVTSAAIPFLSVFWRIAGAVRFRVPFI